MKFCHRVSNDKNSKAAFNESWVPENLLFKKESICDT